MMDGDGSAAGFVVAFLVFMVIIGVLIVAAAGISGGHLPWH